MLNKALLVLGIILGLLFTGCNAVQSANDAQAAIGAAIAIAKAETPLIPVADQAIYSNYVGLAENLDSQLVVCIANVGGVMPKSNKFLACFNAFSSGLLNAQELAQLRLLSPAGQNRAILYITGIVAAVNVALSIYNGQAVSPPQIGSASSAQQIHENLNGKDLIITGGPGEGMVAGIGDKSCSLYFDTATKKDYEDYARCVESLGK